MAFGRVSESKRVRNAAQDDNHFRINVARQERQTANWKNRYGWLVEEYQELHQQLTELSQSSNFLKDLNKHAKERDQRTAKPIPLTTNGQYGWIPSKPEFCLEIYGPDVDKGMPLLPPNSNNMKETL